MWSGPLEPVHARGDRARGQSEELAQPLRRHRLLGVQDRRERLDVGGVQGVLTREPVHQPVDLAVHPPQLDGEGVQVGWVRGRLGLPCRRRAFPVVRCGHAISVVGRSRTPSHSIVRTIPRPRIHDGCRRGSDQRGTVEAEDRGPMSAQGDRTGPLSLVTGATGYIGGRLVPELLAAGHRVRCLARSPTGCATTPGRARRRSCAATSPTPRRSRRRCAGVDVAYYLVHALGTGDDFEETDRRAARIFGEQARAAGVRRDRLPRRAHPGRRARAGALAAPALPRRGGPHPAGLAACRPPCCGRRSSSAPARPPSRCCAI